MRPKRVALFGSTGSIGRSTLDVIRHLPDRFRLVALAAQRSVPTVCRQALAFRPEHVVLTDVAAGLAARRALGSGTNVEIGTGALVDIASSGEIDVLVMAMSGTAGLLPVLAALASGRRVAIATKEIIVGFGEHLTRAARRHGAELLPIDSELAAVHQCIAGRGTGDVRRVILTASGGPFRRTGPPRRASLAAVLRHPTWRMGRKITVDSATLMNKGLEVIETVRLFGLEPAQVEAVIHPQSVVHALVEFRDGSTAAQLSVPDMRLPIQYCLTWPERVPSLARRLHLPEAGRLDFEPADRRRFPCLGLAYRALALGGAAPCVLSAANEVAVREFLAGRIAFGVIPAVIGRTLTDFSKAGPRRTDVKGLLRAEAWAESHARRLAGRARY